MSDQKMYCLIAEWHSSWYGQDCSDRQVVGVYGAKDLAEHARWQIADHDPHGWDRLVIEKFELNAKANWRWDDE